MDVPIEDYKFALAELELFVSEMEGVIGATLREIRSDMSVEKAQLILKHVLTHPSTLALIEKEMASDSLVFVGSTPNESSSKVDESILAIKADEAIQEYLQAEANKRKRKRSGDSRKQDKASKVRKRSRSADSDRKSSKKKHKNKSKDRDKKNSDVKKEKKEKRSKRSSRSKKKGSSSSEVERAEEHESVDTPDSLSNGESAKSRDEAHVEKTTILSGFQSNLAVIPEKDEMKSKSPPKNEPTIKVSSVISCISEDSVPIGQCGENSDIYGEFAIRGGVETPGKSLYPDLEAENMDVDQECVATASSNSDPVGDNREPKDVGSLTQTISKENSEKHEERPIVIVEKPVQSNSSEHNSSPDTSKCSVSHEELPVSAIPTVSHLPVKLEKDKEPSIMTTEKHVQSNISEHDGRCDTSESSVSLETLPVASISTAPVVPEKDEEMLTVTAMKPVQSKRKSRWDIPGTLSESEKSAMALIPIVSKIPEKLSDEISLIRAEKPVQSNSSECKSNEEPAEPSLLQENLCVASIPTVSKDLENPEKDENIIKAMENPVESEHKSELDIRKPSILQEKSPVALISTVSKLPEKPIESDEKLIITMGEPVHSNNSQQKDECDASKTFVSQEKSPMTLNPVVSRVPEKDEKLISTTRKPKQSSGHKSRLDTFKPSVSHEKLPLASTVTASEVPEKPKKDEVRPAATMKTPMLSNTSRQKNRCDTSKLSALQEAPIPPVSSFLDKVEQLIATAEDPVQSNCSVQKAELGTDKPLVLHETPTVSKISEKDKKLNATTVKPIHLHSSGRKARLDIPKSFVSHKKLSVTSPPSVSKVPEKNKRLVTSTEKPAQSNDWGQKTRVDSSKSLVPYEKSIVSSTPTAFNVSEEEEQLITTTVKPTRLDSSGHKARLHSSKSFVSDKKLFMTSTPTVSKVPEKDKRLITSTEKHAQSNSSGQKTRIESSKSLVPYEKLIVSPTPTGSKVSEKDEKLVKKTEKSVEPDSSGLKSGLDTSKPFVSCEPSEPIDSQQQSQEQNIKWTKEQDKHILVICQKLGASDESFKLACRAVGTQQYTLVKKRFYELMEVISKALKNKTTRS